MQRRPLYRACRSQRFWLLPVTMWMLGQFGLEASAQTPLETAFTYQGHLKIDGSPAAGSFDLEFTLYDAETGGSIVAGPVCADNVDVQDGLFSIEVDFGFPAFNGEARWLAIGVRADSTVGNCATGTYTPLTSRQPLTAAPYALALPGLYTQQNPTSPNILGGHTDNAVTAGVVGAVIGGGGSLDNGMGSPERNKVTDNYGVVGGGRGNQAGDNAGTSSQYATVGGGFSNTASGEHSTVGGGVLNNASRTYATIGGGHINTASGEYSTVGGGNNNDASDIDSTVGGGSDNDASGVLSTVGGGYSNDASSYSSTIGGGYNNDAPGYTSAVGGGEGNSAWGNSSTVGGGYGNAALGNSSTVGGGYSNKASGDTSTVGGGYNNEASGNTSTVGGGTENIAGGEHSFAAGRFARVRTALDVGGNDFDGDEGTFVWADSTNALFQSTGPNQFLIRASGGVGIGTNAPQATLHVAEGASGTGVILPGLRVEQNATSPSLIGGHTDNTVTGGVVGAVIAGGGLLDNGTDDTERNSVTDDYGVVGGGRGNRAGDNAGTPSDQGYATVGGGYGNNASATFSIVGGGGINNASATYSTVGGGDSNSASGLYGTVGGGYTNDASGVASTVSGGYSNLAGGKFSFAAGRRAKARTAADVGGADTDGDEGTFVWADSTNADFQSTGPNQFLIRAAGGVGIGSTNPIGNQLFVQGSTSVSTATFKSDKGANYSHLHYGANGDWYIRSATTSGVVVLQDLPGNAGNVQIGTSPPSAKLTVTGDICATGTIGACSDARFKENVETIAGALQKVEQLRGVTFDWKGEEFADHQFAQGRQVGFIAQEVERVLPQAVSRGSDGYLSLDYGRVTPLLVEALRELRAEKDAEIERLRSEKDCEIAELNGRLERLEALVTQP